MVGYGGKDLQNRKVLSLEWKSEGVMDDDSGESMEPMEEVPLIQLGEAETTGWVMPGLNLKNLYVSVITFTFHPFCSIRQWTEHCPHPH